MQISLLSVLGFSLVGYCYCFAIPPAPQRSTCEHEGREYPVGSQITKYGCTPCTCTPSGEFVCAIFECPAAPCVDYEMGQCCASCPNGPNCRLPDGSIMSAFETKTLQNGGHCYCYGEYQGFGIGPNYPDALCTRTSHVA